MTNKIFVLLICFLFCVSTTANALLLNPLTTQAVGMVARTTVGQAVKIGSKRVLVGTSSTAVGMGIYETAKSICIKKGKCGDLADDIAEYFDDSNYNDVYKDLYFVASVGDRRKFKSPTAMCHYAMSNYHNDVIHYKFEEVSPPSFKHGDDVYCSGSITFARDGGELRHYKDAPMGRAYSNNDEQLQDSSDFQKRLEEQKRILKEILSRLDDDDINKIINNNEKEITITIDKYCSENSCDEIEEKFAQEIEKDESKYDIDKINKQNCEVKDDKIVSCENAKKEKDEETEEETTEEEQTQEENSKKEAPKCKDSDMFKEFCEFLDWVDDEPEEPKDTKVDVDEEDESNDLDEEMINVMKACPADMQFTITMLGKSMTFKLSTMPFCLVAQKIRPYLISAGSLSALFILAGIKRD